MTQAAPRRPAMIVKTRLSVSRILLTGAAGAAFTLLGACQTVAADASPPQATSPQTGHQATSPVGAQQQVEPGFTYVYPDMVMDRNPGLTGIMDARRATAKAAYDKLMATYDNKAGGPPASELISAMRWVADSETVGLTVMLGDGASYEGGAHGMNWTDSLIWDRKAGKVVGFADLFTDAARAKAALLPAYCNALDKERLVKRGTPTAKGEIFGNCPDPFESEVYPTGAVNGRYTQIGFSLAPYTAGPYAEGQYNFTIPLDTALQALVKPDYRVLFVVK